MAIRYRKDRKSPWQVYWNNPITGIRETKSFADEGDAKGHDSLMKHRIKYERDYFAPTEHADDAEEGVLTVGDVLHLYLKAKRLKADNLRDTLLHVKYILPMIGHIPVMELSKADMRSVVEYLGNPRFILRDYKHKKAVRIDYAPCAQNTINRKISVFKASFNWAEDQDIIPANPIQRFKAPRGKDQKFAPPTPAEANRILKVASEHVRRVVALGIGTGARIGPSELFRLSWADVILSENTIRIWSANKNLDIPYRDLDLKPNVAKALKLWKKADEEKAIPLIIHWKGKPVKSIKTAWWKTLERAGIDREKRPMRPYDLRHAFATEALRKKADLKSVAKLMGHADETMLLKRYQHVVPDLEREAVDSVSELEIPDTLSESNYL